MKKLQKHLFVVAALMISVFLFTACGTINIRGQTFKYGSVSIDWGTADEEAKTALFETYLVSNEQELKAVLKTQNNRDKRVTSFGTDGTYATKNSSTNEILDSGYWRQDDKVITLAETTEGLSEEGAFTLEANEKGYIVTVVLDEENSIYAKYQYIEQ